jgi:Acetyl-coenzyme A transporter 1
MKRRPSPTMSSSTTTTSEAPPVAGIFSRTRFMNQDTENSAARVRIRLADPSSSSSDDNNPIVNDVEEDDHKDGFNYALLIALYTLQGIPMGLSASIPFLIQQKVRLLASSTAHQLAGSVVSSAAASATAGAAARVSYNANAIFALCSWPFSLKLLYAPVVDACFLRGFGRRKSWIVPAQALAGILMVLGANFVERQLGLGVGHTLGESINVKGVTAFFFALYFLMATQDIAVDGWALTMLSKKNRGRGPICNSIGQNIGYFLSFVGFLALNDTESSEALWRPLLGLTSNPERGLVSLGSFIRFMGYFMLVTTTAVAVFKKEVSSSPRTEDSYQARLIVSKKIDDDDKELDASEILILLTYRLPTSLSDNVKFLKAVEYGLSKSTTAVSATRPARDSDAASLTGSLTLFTRVRNVIYFLAALVSDRDSSPGHHGSNYCYEDMAQFPSPTIHDSIQATCDRGSDLGCINVACLTAGQTKLCVWAALLLVPHRPFYCVPSDGEQYAVQCADDVLCQAR